MNRPVPPRCRHRFVCSESVFLYLVDPESNEPSSGFQISYSCVTNESNSHVATKMVRTEKRFVIATAFKRCQLIVHRLHVVEVLFNTGERSK